MRTLLALGAACLMALPAPAQQPILIDRHAVDLFDHIPDTFLTAARNLRMMFSNRSVGQNIHEALDYFQAASWAQTPAAARRDYTDSLWNWKTFTAADLAAGTVPERIRFQPDPVKYDCSNWIFEQKSGSWSELTADFIQQLGPAYADAVDVWSYQFSYLNVTENDNIADPDKGFFTDNANAFDIHDLEDWLAQHPDKTFFFWTTSLARGIGTSVSTAFNERMREYCQTHGRILFDMADIISHTDQGLPCFDNRDGVPYVAMSGQSENHPDDGFDWPAICQDYTTETEGGHLGSVSAGKVRMAKAFWVLMARIAGWDGQVGAEETPPLVDPKHLWTGRRHSFGGPVHSRWRFSEETFEDGGYTYRLLQQSGDPQGEGWFSIGAFRQDGPRVWSRLVGGEILYYDFCLMPGDTMTREDPSGPTLLIVREVDTLTLTDGIPRRRLFLHCPDDPEGLDYGLRVWVEGLGGLEQDLLADQQPCALDVGGEMTCFFRDGEQIYLRDGETECWPTVAVHDTAPETPRVYPNPFGGWVHIEGVAPGTIGSLADVSGRIVHRAPVNGGWALGHLPAGYYVLRLEVPGQPTPVFIPLVKTMGNR